MVGESGYVEKSRDKLSEKPELSIPDAARRTGRSMGFGLS
jgi:hypothetical protein